MIAMAISCDPALLIADEPTTALDVTVQAHSRPAAELRDRRGMSMIFITHDLGIIAEIADQVAVMYQGRNRGERGRCGKFSPIPNIPIPRDCWPAAPPQPALAATAHGVRLYGGGH
jgi:ABC-type dipeptide/oligopeptide/nickel transport system ATPase component